MKKIDVIKKTIVFILFFFLSQYCFAYSVPKLRHYVNDYANLMSSETVNLLEYKLQDLDKKDSTLSKNDYDSGIKIGVKNIIKYVQGKFINKNFSFNEYHIINFLNSGGFLFILLFSIYVGNLLPNCWKGSYYLIIFFSFIMIVIYFGYEFDFIGLIYLYPVILMLNAIVANFFKSIDSDGASGGSGSSGSF